MPLSGLEFPREEESDFKKGRYVKKFAGCMLAVLLSIPVMAIIQPEKRHARWLERPTLSPQLEQVQPGTRSQAGTAAAAIEQVEGGSWRYFMEPRTGRLGLVIGSGTPLLPSVGGRAADTPTELEALEPALDAFVARHAALQPSRGELVLDRELTSIRADGELVSAYYQWVVDGVPVENGRVLIRANHGNVTQFGTQWMGDVAAETRPTVDADEAFRVLRTYGGHEELGQLVDDAELVLQPEAAGDRLAYRLVWKMQYRTIEGIETWTGRVDARTGEVIEFVDGNHYLRASGGVYPRSVFFGNEVLAPMQDLGILLNGSATTGSTGGNFTFGGEDLETTMSGRWFDVDCQFCSNPEQPFFSSTIGSGRIDLGFGDTGEVGNGVTTAADRNTWYHANYARLIAFKWLPSEPFFSTPNFGIRTNINASCNATYDGQNINFYRESTTCNNTGNVADVVYHEWGHGVDLNTFPGSGGTGEGSADVNSIQVSHSAQIGPGFRLTGAPVRDLDSNTSARGVFTFTQSEAVCGNSVHCRGEVFGQTAWDLAQGLITKYGYHTGWRESERLFYLSLPDQGEIDPSDPNAIYLAYMNADDDNGNLDDGTPNGAEIFAAFQRHGMATTNFGGSATCSRPAQPNMTVTSSCDDFEVSWDTVAGVDRYEVFRTELDSDRAFLPVATVAAGQTSWTDTDVIPGVDYYYQVMAVNPDGCESTVENPPLARLDAQPIISVTAAASDDTPRGNRSGFPDPGEDVDITFDVGNFGEVSADGLAGTVIPLTAGVTMLVDEPQFASVAVGGVASNDGTVRFTSDAAQVNCGDVLRFQYIPADATACASDASFFEVQLGQPDGLGGFVCDDTPACFAPATFNGLDIANAGVSCGETELQWSAAASNCLNAEITYNVYRGTSPIFPYDETTRIATVSGTSFQDALLEPDEVFYYVVRAFDSRSGEETNEIVKSAIPPASPDISAPIFNGLTAAASGTACGETVLSWDVGLESCNAPVTYEIFRSTDPGFVPGPENRIGSSLTTSFADNALMPDAAYTYVVAARDALGNETMGNARLTVSAAVLDALKVRSQFEGGDNGGWTVIDPNDAVRGNWEVGDPEASASQPEDDFTEGGTECWVTGAPAFLGDGNNNDIDSGTTTLVSRTYDLSDTVDPKVRYARWFSNAQGASPGEDELIVEVSGSGQAFVELERVIEDSGQWEVVEFSLNGVVPITSAMRFRFTAADLGEGSLVDAAIDDFEILDVGQGCLGCATPVTTVGTINTIVNGNDVVIDWDLDPVVGERYVIYQLSGPDFSEEIRIGSTANRSFVHEGALNNPDSFYYRVSAVDACGNESDLK